MMICFKRHLGSGIRRKEIVLTPHVATFPFVGIGKIEFKRLTSEENTRSVPGLNLILEVHENPHMSCFRKV